MRVDINHVKHLLNEIDKINELPFDQIEWCEGEREVYIPQVIKEQWKFVGMTNCSFVDTGFYEEEAFKQPQQQAT
jgi:hypothetical protein